MSIAYAVVYLNSTGAKFPYIQGVYAKLEDAQKAYNHMKTEVMKLNSTNHETPVDEWTDGTRAYYVVTDNDGSQDIIALRITYFEGKE